MKKLDKLYDDLHESVLSLSTIILILVLTVYIRSVQVTLNIDTKFTNSIILFSAILIGIISSCLLIPIIVKIKYIKSKHRKELSDLFD